MTSTAGSRGLTELAALARVRELGGRMEARTAREGPPPEVAAELKAIARVAWGLGDYDRFARQLVWDFGPELVEACGIGPGQRVLDVAAGTGNVALRAAEAGADVVACDLAPENVEAGRRNGEAAGHRIEWLVADAEALPFADGEFDVVTSSAGAMFAPDHAAVARELIRVCRSGGTIGMTNYTPDGGVGEFFGVFEPYAPSPPGALPAVLWGDEGHVRDLLGDGADLELTRKTAVERVEGGPRGYVDFFKETFGPVVGIYGLLADDPEKSAALDQDFLDFATRLNRGEPGGPAEYRYGYLLVVARKR
jgi:SAM-dependent methyltransferase